MNKTPIQHYCTVQIQYFWSTYKVLLTSNKVNCCSQKEFKVLLLHFCLWASSFTITVSFFLILSIASSPSIADCCTRVGLDHIFVFSCNFATVVLQQIEEEVVVENSIERVISWEKSLMYLEEGVARQGALFLLQCSCLFYSLLK